MALPNQDVYSILSSRRQKFAEHLRTKGLDPDEATLLRHSAFLLDNIQLGMNAEDAPTPEVDEAACTATFTITTYNPDRYGDVVIPKGCIPHLSKGYRKNPRVFFAHKQNELPIGSCRTPMGELALQFFDDKAKGTCFFHCQTRESEVVFRLVARKELQASSIGFLPVKAAIFEPDKTPNRPETDDLGDDIHYFREDPFFKPLRFLEWDMVEWSIVPIPANAECISEHLSRGSVEGERISPVLRKALEPYALKKTKTLMGFTPPTDSEIDNAAKKEMAEEEAKLAEKLKEVEAENAPVTKEFSGEDLIAPPETPSSKPEKEEEDPQKGWPLGAKFLARSIASYEETSKWIKEMDCELDQPRVKRLAQKKLAKLHKLSLAALKLGSELYPDKFSYEASPEEKSLEDARKKVRSSSEEALILELTALKNKMAELEEKAKTDSAVEKTLLSLVENQKRIQTLIFEFTGRK